MRPIIWLHLSDVHLRPRDAWAQVHVLRAMCDDVASRRTTSPFDFVLLSGDLAFSGKPEEYEIAATFLDDLSDATGVSKAHIYCVPGNHDINRQRQNMTFTGARTTLHDQNRTDAFLSASSRDELATLLQREEGYRAFQGSYFTDQDRRVTDDGLAYVAQLVIEDVRLAIVGLDSAWLAEGGLSDHGQLLIGERQVVNALRLAQHEGDPPHVLLAMSHHPLHVLREFDRRPIQAHIERNCHFLHCGHLHDPETRPAGHGAHGCLTLAAGSSFDTRQAHNSYTVVTLDLLRAICSVTTVHYNPGDVAFAATATAEFPFEVQPTDTCSVRALATAISAAGPEPPTWPHYLAALLLNQKAEIPIPTAAGFTLGSFAVLEAEPHSDYKSRTTAFTAFRNALRVLYPRVPLARIFQAHGTAVAEYGAALAALAQTHHGLTTRLDALEVDARGLAGIEPAEFFSHTIAMLTEIANARDWVRLREQAARHCDSPSQVTALTASRMLVLALANSTERADKETAVSLYLQLQQRGALDATDFGNWALLLVDLGDPGRGQDVILLGIAACAGSAIGYLADVGHRIVETTGDRAFRERLHTAIAARNTP